MVQKGFKKNMHQIHLSIRIWKSSRSRQQERVDGWSNLPKLRCQYRKDCCLWTTPQPPDPKSRSLFSVGHTYTKKLLFI